MARRFDVTLAVSLFLLLSLEAATGIQDQTFIRNFVFEKYCQGRSTCKAWDDGVVELQSHWSKSGGFSSKDYFYHGVFSVEMKLPWGYSGGILPAIYLQTQGFEKGDPRYFEIDYEFIGDWGPKGMTIHTNLFVGSYQYLQQYSFPFDPSAAWHKYTLVWNSLAVTWLIDNVPIRVTPRRANLPWPSQPLQLKGVIWDSSSWSALKADYSRGPISVYMRRFFINACRVSNPWDQAPKCAGYKGARIPWNRKLTPMQILRYNRFRKNHFKVDYGWDNLFN